MPDMELANIIRERRKARDLSVEEAAASAGISVSYWQKLEVGQMKNPSLDILKKLSSALSCPLADLLPELTAA